MKGDTESESTFAHGTKELQSKGQRSEQAGISRANTIQATVEISHRGKTENKETGRETKGDSADGRDEQFDRPNEEAPMIKSGTRTRRKSREKRMTPRRAPFDGPANSGLEIFTSVLSEGRQADELTHADSRLPLASWFFFTP